jgi:hypothetical protein
MEYNHTEKKITARELYPDLAEAQLMEAEENLYRYLKLAMHIHQGTKCALTVLDATIASPKMEERSNSSLKT